MTSVSDVIEVMGVVAACHHRTAPRMDDREAVLVTAGIWAELFSAYNLSKADLVAAVKKRARGAADAPEPAEIIAVAREIRNDRIDRMDPDERPHREVPILEGAELDEVAERRRKAISKFANNYRDAL